VRNKNSIYILFNLLIYYYNYLGFRKYFSLLECIQTREIYNNCYFYRFLNSDPMRFSESLLRKIAAIGLHKKSFFFQLMRCITFLSLMTLVGGAEGGVYCFHLFLHHMAINVLSAVRNP